jgi:hypothetical protein
MLKMKDRPATADATHRATSPGGGRHSRHQQEAARSSTATGASAGRSTARMFRTAEESPSPSRKGRKGSPERHAARNQPGAADAHQANGKNIAVVVAGKGSEVCVYVRSL